jgi:hypothetical protein
MERRFDALMAWVFVHLVPPSPPTPWRLYLWFVERAGRWAYRDGD